MSGPRYRIFRAALEGLYFSGAYRMLRPFVGGVGAILMLHHVRPARDDPFQPNRLLEVTPAFFESVIERLRDMDVDLVSLDEMCRRTAAGEDDRRFVCITFDDGYRDNREYAYPILKRHNVPFTVYVATRFADRTGELWWLALEAVIARNEYVTMNMDGAVRRFDTGSTQARYLAFETIYQWLRARPTEDELRIAVRELAARHGVDVASFSADLCMGWDELAAFAADPLLTVGAHTVSHPILTKLDARAVRAELAESRDIIAGRLGVRPRHLAYPVGDRVSAGLREFAIAAELGFDTAVTTRPGVLFAAHVAHRTALPRLSLNGHFQRPRYAEVLLSGAATGLWNRFRRLDVT